MGFGSSGFRVWGLRGKWKGQTLKPEMEAGPLRGSLHGWLSKLWSLLGYSKYSVPYYNRDPKRDHNFDNHPHGDYNAGALKF